MPVRASSPDVVVPPLPPGLVSLLLHALRNNEANWLSGNCKLKIENLKLAMALALPVSMSAGQFEYQLR